MERLDTYRAQLGGLGAAEVVRWAIGEFGRERIILGSSLGAEDQVLTAMLAAATPEPRIFTLDTGRLFQETYDLMDRTRERFGVRFEVYVPDTAELEALLSRHGPNLFLESVESRKACCEVRKVRPLARVLPGLSAWIAGLRRDQGPTRQAVEVIEWDAERRLYRVCPLFDWTEERLWAYLREHRIPYNVLHDRGFPSVGCAPCTRAVQPGEDLRAGRWWWEQPGHRECGLHRRGGV